MLGKLVTTTVLLFAVWWRMMGPWHREQLPSVRACTVDCVDLRIGSFNVCGIFTSPTSMRRAASCVRKLRSHCDVIVLQEVFFPWVRSYILPSLEGWNVEEMTPNGTGMSGGVLISSRFPMTRLQERIFKTSSGPDLAAPKGALQIVLDGSARTVITGVHLQDNNWDANGVTREAQLREIHSLGTSEMEIVVGDFNIDPELEPKLASQAEMLLGPRISPVVSTTDCGRMIDYAHSSRARGTVVVTSWDSSSSDHRAVIVTVALPAST